MKMNAANIAREIQRIETRIERLGILPDAPDVRTRVADLKSDIAALRAHGTYVIRPRV